MFNWRHTEVKRIARGPLDTQQKSHNTWSTSPRRHRRTIERRLCFRSAEWNAQGRGEALFTRAVFTTGLHNWDYAAALCSLLSPRFKDYAKEDTSALLSYCNTLLDVSLSSACRDFPSAAASLFRFLFWIFSETKREAFALDRYIGFVL